MDRRDQLARLEGRVKAPKDFGNNLEARRAEFLTTPGIAEEEKRGRESQLTPVPQPEERKATSAYIYWVPEEFSPMEERLEKPAKAGRDSGKNKITSPRWCGRENA